MLFRSNKTLEQELDLCAAHKVPIIITSLGAVPQIVDRVHAYGGIVFHDVVNRRHAEKASDAGVAGLIAVSTGAGGHTGLANPFALIAEIRRFFNGTLLLAGSLSSGLDIAAAQIIGADLAYMGTRFLATRECASDAAYKAMIHESQLADITTTAAVSGITANFLQPSLDRAGISADGPALLPVRSMSMPIWPMRSPRQQTSQNLGVTYGRPVLVLAALITAPR